MSPEPGHVAASEHGDHVDGEPQERKKGVKDYTHWGIPKPAIESPAYNAMERLRQRMFYAVDIPVTWIREKIVVPLQARNKAGNVYYHRKFGRAPTIDECQEGDMACYFEANEQFKRDSAVDGEILQILRKRKNYCISFERDDWAKNCREAMEEYEVAHTNFFLRYGEVGHFGTAIDLYMRQKHRMIWERRHPDKVDYMHARERLEHKYIVPVTPGVRNPVNLPDNTRNQLHRKRELGTGGTLIFDPDSPQDSSKHYGKDYNQKDYQGKFES